MSDGEAPAKRGGYRIEYASSGRAKCKGPKPCTGTTIVKGAMRLGSLVEIGGHTNFQWKHWGCMTARMLANIKKSIEESTDLDGYDELEPGDKAKIDKAWEEGHVADEDIPESARKPEKDGDGDDEEKPKKKRAAAKKKKADDEDEEDGEEEKPKPKRAPRKKKAADDDDEDGEEKPKPKRAPRKKKDANDDDKPKKKPAAKRAAPKKKKAADSDEDGGEDFGDAIEDVSAGDDDDDAEAGKKRKRAPATKKPAAKKRKAKAASDDDDDE